MPILAISRETKRIRKSSHYGTNTIALYKSTTLYLLTYQFNKTEPSKWRPLRQHLGWIDIIWYNSRAYNVHKLTVKKRWSANDSRTEVTDRNKRSIPSKRCKRTFSNRFIKVLDFYQIFACKKSNSISSMLLKNNFIHKVSQNPLVRLAS